MAPDCATRIARSGISESTFGARCRRPFQLGGNYLSARSFLRQLQMPHVAYAFARQQVQGKVPTQKGEGSGMKEAKQRQRQQQRLQQCLESVQEWRYDPTCDGASRESGGVGTGAVCPNGRCDSSRGPIIIRYITTLLHINILLYSKC